MIGNVFRRFWDWLHTPIQQPYDPLSLGIVVVVILVSIALYRISLSYLENVTA